MPRLTKNEGDLLFLIGAYYGENRYRRIRHSELHPSYQRIVGNLIKKGIIAAYKRRFRGKIETSYGFGPKGKEAYMRHVQGASYGKIPQHIGPFP